MKSQTILKAFRFSALAGLVMSANVMAVTGGGQTPEEKQAELQASCDASSMLSVSSNPAESGPWVVGSRTITIDGLTTEVFYPAVSGSQYGQPLKSWDVRQFLPDSEAAKLPDEVSFRECETCYADLPLDTQHGPYPVIIYVHGTASTRIASLAFFEHWASRGFVVLSADNPYIYQKDAMESTAGILLADQTGDTLDLIEEIRRPSYFGQAAFLRGNVDSNRIGLAGHSAGGFAIRNLGDEAGVRVLMPMASGGTNEGSDLISTMILGGLEDTTASFSLTTSAYEDSPVKKRLAGFANMGHVGFVDVCRGVELRQQYGLEIPDAMQQLLDDGCGEGYVEPEAGWTMINYLSTAGFEETLKCDANSANKINQFQSVFGSQNVLYQEF